MDLRDKIWTAIRVLKSFTYEEIALMTDSHYKNVAPYLLSLYRMDYIKQAGMRREGDGKRKNLWRLARNTGPHAPMVISVFRDPNLGTVQELKGELVWISPEAAKKSQRRRSNVA